MPAAWAAALPSTILEHQERFDPPNFNVLHLTPAAPLVGPKMGGFPLVMFRLEYYCLACVRSVAEIGNVTTEVCGFDLLYMSLTATASYEAVS